MFRAKKASSSKQQGVRNGRQLPAMRTTYSDLSTSLGDSLQVHIPDPLAALDRNKAPALAEWDGCLIGFHAEDAGLA